MPKPPFPTRGGGTKDHAPMPKGGEHSSTPGGKGGKYTQGPKSSEGPKRGKYPGTETGK
jgi:hypothetical protein